MLNDGEISASPVLLDLLPPAMGEPLIPWPADLMDLAEALVIQSGGALASSQRSNVWM